MTPSSGWAQSAETQAAPDGLTFSPATPPGTAAAADAGSPSWATVWKRSTLLGDIGGLRPFLDRYGMTLSLQETSEILGNVSGGIHQGADYDGVTTGTLQMDTQKAFGLVGGLFNISGLQIHGRNLSADNLGSLQTASGIESDRATRLWELWYQQAFLGGQVDVKLGQQSLDQEFMGSQYAALFVNTMFGWPMVPSADMLAGGPAYPLSSLGVRVRAKPTEATTLLAGVFDDNPAGPGSGDPQQLDGSGTNFRLNDSPLVIAELQFATPASGDMDTSGLGSLPGVYKLGAWYDFGKFADQRFGTDGLSLADPASNGIPREHRGNYSIYAVMDQTLWSPGPESSQSLGFFARAMGAPQQDRNLIDFSLNAGLVLKAPLPGRDGDSFGVGGGFTTVSDDDRALDRDTLFFAGSPMPLRSSESYIEVTYQMQVNPWWQVQPDLQYTFNPGGGIADPDSSTGERVKNETVLGVRTNITF